MSIASKKKFAAAPPNAFDAPPGLPGPLPVGERILWQGRPSASGITRRVFHAPLVGLWFAGLALWAGVPALMEGSLLDAAILVGPTVALGFGAIAILSILGWFAARTTTYTITNKRLVLRVGIALPVTLNLPFAMIEGASLRAFADGSGDLPIQLREGNRVAYLHIWPHARPWHVTRPEPMLRSIPEAGTVAAILAGALAGARDANEETAAPVVVQRSRASVRPSRLAAAS